MDNYGRYKKSGMGGLTKVMLGLLTAVVIGFAAFGVYKLVDDNGTMDLAPETSAPQTDQGQPAEEEPAETGQDSGESDSAFASMSAAGTETMSAEAVAEKVIPSVVCIQASGSSLSASSQGSGIILSEDGYIATNAHVVSGYSKFKVILSDDTAYEATLIGEDDTTDLALLKIEAAGLTPATLGDSDDLKIAETVMAVGNPGGVQFSSSVTMGIVSAKDRPITTSMGASLNTIQTDAAINPGNSGGALVDMTGAVVGICSAKYVVENYEGMGFAITINEALPILNELKEYGYVKSRGVMGMRYTMVDSMTSRFYNLPVGLYVQSNLNEKAPDIQTGDVITQVDGKNMTDESALKSALSSKLAGDKVTVKYYRSSTGQYYDTEVELIENESVSTQQDQTQQEGDSYSWPYSRYLGGYMR